MGGWWQLWSGAQKWYKPPGLFPSLLLLTHPLQRLNPHPSLRVFLHPSNNHLYRHPINSQPMGPSLAEGLQGQKALAGERGSEALGLADEPCGRKEPLDALHQAQKRQATLQELLIWAQRLRAEMDAQSTPSSLADVQSMLEERQDRKVSGPDPEALPGILPSLWPPPYCDPTFLLGSFCIGYLCLSPLPSNPLSGLPHLSSLPLGLFPPTQEASASGI